jgi:hypothetical protein
MLQTIFLFRLLRDLRTSAAKALGSALFAGQSRQTFPNRLVQQQETQAAIIPTEPHDLSENNDLVVAFHFQMKFQDGIFGEILRGHQAQAALADIVNPGFQGLGLDFVDVSGSGRKDRKSLYYFRELKTIESTLITHISHGPIFLSRKGSQPRPIVTALFRPSDKNFNP